MFFYTRNIIYAQRYVTERREYSKLVMLILQDIQVHVVLLILITFLFRENSFPSLDFKTKIMSQKSCVTLWNSVPPVYNYLSRYFSSKQKTLLSVKGIVTFLSDQLLQITEKREDLILSFIFQV